MNNTYNDNEYYNSIKHTESQVIILPNDLSFKMLHNFKIKLVSLLSSINYFSKNKFLKNL